MDNKQVKKCPFCGEEILVVAKKCKFCGEWLYKKDIKKEFNWTACTLTWIWGIWHGTYKFLWYPFLKIILLLLFLFIYSSNILGIALFNITDFLCRLLRMFYIEALSPINHVVNARIQLFIFIICSIFINVYFSYRFALNGNKWISQNNNKKKIWIKWCVTVLVMIPTVILEVALLFFILHDLLIFSFWYD